MKYYPSIDIQATGRRIRELRKQKHLRVEDVSAFMGFETGQAVYKWQRGESLPTVDNLYALVRGKMILPSHGKEFFTSYGKHFFTRFGKQIFT